MKWIGNDIIDLALLREHPRADQPRFWRKILTEAEYRWLSARDNPGLDIWKLWALKESAYKCYFQLTGRRFYGPKKFSCRELTPGTEEAITWWTWVDTPAGAFYANVRQFPSYLQALSAASPRLLELAACRTFLISGRNASDLSRQLRAQARQWVAQGLDLPENELVWDDSMGRPRLFYRGQAIDVGFTLSHHGRWGAAAIMAASPERLTDSGI